jgi:hypothetical protein
MHQPAIYWLKVEILTAFFVGTSTFRHRPRSNGDAVNWKSSGEWAPLRRLRISSAVHYRCPGWGIGGWGYRGRTAPAGGYGPGGILGLILVNPVLLARI